jgi:UDP-N-acetylglucosamine 2-epimerase (non-hydrolysing)
MAPIVRCARDLPEFAPVLISTGQHQDLLGPTLDALSVTPDIVLDSDASHGMSSLVAQVMSQFADVVKSVTPDVVLVQGDTSTALAATLASFYEDAPVAHVEAGLRSRDLGQPFPEEGNRLVIDHLARWRFAPTSGARENLLREGVPEERIRVTGNTGIDSLLWMLERRPQLVHSEDLLLITLHRRESAGEGFLEILRGLGEFLDNHPGIRAAWPVHPNPIVASAIAAVPSITNRVELISALSYDRFVELMAMSRVILSDSGGVQEEAPSLGKRVLVVREVTERPEALAPSLNVLVGRSRQAVASALEAGWDAPRYEGPIPADNPFGDGRAAVRILNALANEAT